MNAYAESLKLGPIFRNDGCRDGNNGHGNNGHGHRVDDG